MFRASRIVIISLLVLVQMIAPLVHAHTGGGQSPGVMHVPGLEFLGHGGSFAHSPADSAWLDVIVSPAQGFDLKSDPVAPAPSPEYTLPSCARILPAQSFKWEGRSAGLPCHSLRQAFTHASPRAPPMAAS